MRGEFQKLKDHGQKREIENIELRNSLQTAQKRETEAKSEFQKLKRECQQLTQKAADLKGEDRSIELQSTQSKLATVQFKLEYCERINASQAAELIQEREKVSVG